MPPPRPHWTWQQLLARGADNVVYYYHQLGHGLAFIAAKLRSLFGAIDTTVIRQVVSRTLMAIAAAAALATGPQMPGLPDSRIPISPNMPAAVGSSGPPLYRTRVIVPISDPAGGPDIFRTIVTDWPFSPSRQDVTAEVRRRLDQLVSGNDTIGSIHGRDELVPGDWQAGLMWRSR